MSMRTVADQHHSHTAVLLPALPHTPILPDNTRFTGSAFLKALELLFALQFFVLRIINLTIVIAMFWYHGFNHLLGWGGTLVLPVGGLQWFWMYKIICSALGVKSKAKLEKEGKEKEGKEK